MIALTIIGRVSGVPDVDLRRFFFAFQDFSLEERGQKRKVFLDRFSRRAIPAAFPLLERPCEKIGFASSKGA